VRRARLGAPARESVEYLRRLGKAPAAFLGEHEVTVGNDVELAPPAGERLGLMSTVD
jgi:hypothetical protein